MGYEIRRTILLEFEDGDEKATLKMRAPKMAFFQGFDEMTVDQQSQAFAEHVVEWDLTADGEPLPVTLEGVHELDPATRMLFIREWLAAAREVAPPLARRSNAGEQSAAESISMESL